MSAPPPDPTDGESVDATVGTIPGTTYEAIRERVSELGREVVAPHAVEVDREARFPTEAFDAFREEKLLSAYVPVEYGGMGLGMPEIAGLCETLGHFCASTAMIYAMHQIQVACLVHHGQGSEYFRDYLRRMVDEQLLLASATTEIGVGGDLRSSVCAVDVRGDAFELEKKAPVISYALDADAILVTCRRAPDAAASDQVMVLCEREHTELDQISGWDTLGFRGTCSLGFLLKARGDAAQIVPVPFGDILARSMHPFSHVVWSSLWLGLAADAVTRARTAVRAKARKSPDTPQVAGLRLAEVDEVLYGMRAGLRRTVERYRDLLERDDPSAFQDFSFAIQVNNTKIVCSELVVDIVGRALQIVGISGYKNDSDLSLTRHLRDAYGAALMVNNDRIRGHNATMQIVSRG